MLIMSYWITRALTEKKNPLKKNGLFIHTSTSKGSYGIGMGLAALVVVLFIICLLLEVAGVSNFILYVGFAVDLFLRLLPIP